MIELTFPDGAVRSFADGASGADVAAAISKSLAKKAVATVVDGEIRDLADPIGGDARIEILTREDPRALSLIRHDAAHVMAEAVQELWPGTQVTIGPVIENGFYYDFYRPEGPFTPEDLPKIEAKMREIIARDAAFTKEVWTRDQAKDFFATRGEAFKVELVDAIPADQELKMYRQGQWIDLCRGPHMTSTGKVGTAFKLMKVAGAYWRGDSDRNEMLTRIYGTAWAGPRTSCRRLPDDAGGGGEARPSPPRPRDGSLPLPGGRRPASSSGTPRAGRCSRSWSPTCAAGLKRQRLPGGQRPAGARQGPVGDLRPLGLVQGEHVQGAVGRRRDRRRARIRAEADELPRPCADLQAWSEESYRDLPMRLAEFGAVHRYEPSGALHGLMRVRGFTQDDAHMSSAPRSRWRPSA